MSMPPAGLPAPKLSRRSRWLPSLIWAVPALAALVGLSLVSEALLDRGPTVTISFSTAEGIEPGKTKVKFKNVDVGEVKAVRLNDTRTRVLVSVEFAKDAGAFAASDSRFWVVRPRLAGSGISGLSTLLSGAYIGVDAGHAKNMSRFFVGKEEPPVVTSDIPGRRFVLTAEDIGSLDIGSPIFYRRLQVGQILGFTLSKDGKHVILQAFIRAPYDRFVNTDTRFWHASGVDLQFDANGLKLETQSLVSIMLGGIAFANPAGETMLAEAPEDQSFDLAANHFEAMRRTDIPLQPVTLRFNQSIRGLTLGAPVDFRGIEIGNVLSIDLAQDPVSHDFYAPVLIRIDPGRLAGVRPSEARALSADRIRETLKVLIRKGLRAQLKTGNLLSGQLYVALDFFPEAPPAGGLGDFEIPTVPGDIEALQQQLSDILRKLDKIPFDQLGADLHNTLLTLDSTLRHVDSLTMTANDKMIPDLEKSLDEVRHAVESLDAAMAGDAPMQEDSRRTMQALTEATRSLKALTDSLDRHPESLLRGKKGDSP